jgi:hypothetical protein
MVARSSKRALGKRMERETQKINCGHRRTTGSRGLTQIPPLWAWLPAANGGILAEQVEGSRQADWSVDMVNSMEGSMDESMERAWRR